MDGIFILLRSFDKYLIILAVFMDSIFILLRSFDKYLIILAVLMDGIFILLRCFDKYLIVLALTRRHFFPRMWIPTNCACARDKAVLHQFGGVYAILSPRVKYINSYILYVIFLVCPVFSFTHSSIKLSWLPQSEHAPPYAAE